LHGDILKQEIYKLERLGVLRVTDAWSVIMEGTEKQLSVMAKAMGNADTAVVG